MQRLGRSKTGAQHKTVGVFLSTGPSLGRLWQKAEASRTPRAQQRQQRRVPESTRLKLSHACQLCRGRISSKSFQRHSKVIQKSFKSHLPPTSMPHRWLPRSGLASLRLASLNGMFGDVQSDEAKMPGNAGQRWQRQRKNKARSCNWLLDPDSMH